MNISITEERTQQLRELLSAKDELRLQLHKEMMTHDGMERLEEWEKLRERIGLNIQYTLRICDFKEKGDYEDDEAYGHLASDLEELDMLYQQVK
jgi:hypothetical protein